MSKSSARSKRHNLRSNCIVYLLDHHHTTLYSTIQFQALQLSENVLYVLFIILHIITNQFTCLYNHQLTISWGTSIVHLNLLLRWFSLGANFLQIHEALLHRCHFSISLLLFCPHLGLVSVSSPLRFLRENKKSLRCLSMVQGWLMPCFVYSDKLIVQDMKG